MTATCGIIIYQFWYLLMLKLTAELINLEKMVNYIKDFADDNGFDSTAIQQIELAIEELLVNIINYAYPEEQKGSIDIVCECRDHKNLIIKVTDYGSHFDLSDTEIPDINASVEDRKVGGLGVFLAQKMLDSIDYERVDDKNVLTLIKRK